LQFGWIAVVTPAAAMLVAAVRPRDAEGPAMVGPAEGSSEPAMELDGIEAGPGRAAAMPL
jgi:hypothetical protein